MIPAKTKSVRDGLHAAVTNQGLQHRTHFTVPIRPPGSYWYAPSRLHRERAGAVALTHAKELARIGDVGSQEIKSAPPRFAQASLERIGTF